jgi:hypothetical protein
LSPNSTEIIIIAARIPDNPTSISTTVYGYSVLISWTSPYNGGTPLTAFTIVIRQSDGVAFSQDVADCPGTSSIILNSAQCSIPITVLRSAPYNLAWGSSVWAKVSASNLVGDSAYSDEGNGAIILTIPDAPINLANNALVTSMSQVGISWNEG